jgi:hypothetical protein
MELRELKKLATQAYLDVWRAHHTGWCPPPADMRDKKWSATLRETWPDYTSVDVKTSGNSSPKYSELRTWCNEQPSSYWVNGGGNRWYFERRDIAALFKLTFGGAYYHD